MAEIRTVTTLRRKQRESESAIVGYEKRLGQARADLAHINASIMIFEASGDPGEMARYVDVHRLFKHRELSNLCREFLATGPLNTRELANKVIIAKGLDAGDKELAKSIALRIVQNLNQQDRRGTVRKDGKRGGVCVWRLR